MTSRRSFLTGAITAAASARAFGANDRVRLGLIGCGGRGNHLINMASHVGGHEWVAVCDAWDQRRDQTAAKLGAGVQADADHRRLLDRKDIDGVVIATWDNTHSQITIDACHAGKDVFVEKPMTSLPHQGVEVVKAVRETNRVLQVGMQQRSIAHFAEARKRFFESGAIGQVHMVRTIWNANTGYLEKPPAGMEEKPAGLDWEACLGPLPKIPWDPKRYFNRFAYWDISTGGQTGGLFVHMVDVVHWYLNLTKPKAAVALGGIYQYDDGRDTPDNVNGVVEYPQGLTVTFEASISDLNPKDSADIVFLGTNGRLHIFRGGYRFIPAEKGAPEITAPGAAEPDHMRNWLECIRTRKQPNADAESGHYSAVSCHMLNIAYRDGGRAAWQEEWNVQQF